MKGKNGLKKRERKEETGSGAPFWPPAGPNFAAGRPPCGPVKHGEGDAVARLQGM